MSFFTTRKLSVRLNKQKFHITRSSRVLALVITSIGLFIFWDIHRLERDFNQLKEVLESTRGDAIYGSYTLIAMFDRDKIVIIEKDSGDKRLECHLPTLHKVRYDTTIGKNMIVFTASGTDPYNIRLHGGDITLKSWLGIKRSLWVNCTGYVIEGILVDDVLKSN